MKNYSKKEIESLITRFEAQKLPKVEWTHEAHLVVAIWYAKYYPFKEALDLVRGFITRHNTSVGTINNDHDGYHETITAYWLKIAYHFIEGKERWGIQELCNGFINSDQSNSKYLLNFYSEEVLFSVQARHEWVEPDLVNKRVLL